LERILSTLGYDYASDDHWRQRQHEFQLDDQTRQEDAQPEETEEVAGMVSAGLQPSNGFEDCESSMSIGRLLGSVVKRRKLSKSDLPNEEGSPRSVQGLSSRRRCVKCLYPQQQPHGYWTNG